MSELGKVLVVIGITLVIAGALLWAGLGKWMGHLPGDITIKGENITVFIPLGTMLVVSILASVILSLLNRR